MNNGKKDDDFQAGTTVLDVDTLNPEPVTIPDPKPIVFQDFDDARALRAHIFQVPDIKTEVLEIPEWGVKLLLKGMTGTQRALTMKAAMSADGTPDLRKLYAHMCVFGVLHPQSEKQVFQLADMDSLMNEKSGGVIERIAMTVSRISGLEAAAQEVLAKN